MEKAGVFLYQFCVDPAVQAAFFLLPLIVLGFLVAFMKERVERVLLTDFGKYFYYCFAAIGTPVHEASHLAACLLFRHRIKRFSLFFPGQNGRLGYVEHSFDPGSPYQRLGCLFIGISPLLGGVAALILLTLFFVPDRHIFGSFDLPRLTLEFPGYFWALKKALMESFSKLAAAFQGREWNGVLYSILAFGIGSHMIPSSADWKVGGWGLGVFYGALCLFNLILHWMGSGLGAFLSRFTAYLGLPVHIMALVLLLLISAWIMALGVGRIKSFFIPS